MNIQLIPRAPAMAAAFVLTLGCGRTGLLSRVSDSVVTDGPAAAVSDRSDAGATGAGAPVVSPGSGGRAGAPAGAERDAAAARALDAPAARPDVRPHLATVDVCRALTCAEL